MNSRENVRQYHREHGDEFRLKCMIGQAKGLARLATDEITRIKHLNRARVLQAELDDLLKLKETNNE